jgi:hypothetical protein
VLAKGLVAGNELRAVRVLAHYIFVRGQVNAFDPITFESRRNPALFFALALNPHLRQRTENSATPERSKPNKKSKTFACLAAQRESLER